MKFTLGLFAILAIISLGQAHQFPDFGEGPLHEDLQDILDLVPIEEIFDVLVDYMINDNEVQDVLKDIENSTTIEQVLEEFQAIPEVIKFVAYLRKEGINVNHVMNLDKSLDIKGLVLPNSEKYSTMKRTGGLRGMFEDIKKYISYDAFFSIYVDKLKASEAFVNFINQLKSKNFQQIINKLYEIKSFQLILNYLEVKSVNLKITEDLMYIFWNITVPSRPSKTLVEELTDFVTLIPLEKFLDIIIQYVNEDEKVQKALQFVLTAEYHDLLRALEALKEHQALVVYLEKAGLPIIEYIQEMHRDIGMEKYVPPKINDFFSRKFLIKTQKIGDGMQGMFKDLYDVLPLDKIDALFQKKMKTSKVFVDFVTKITSKEMIKILSDLGAHKTYKEFITKTKEKGLDMEGSAILSIRIIGITVPSRPSKTLVEELTDFITLIPLEKFLDIMIQYVSEDEKVQKALQFVLTAEYHDLLRALEALKEHQALVVYLEKAGLPIIEYIQEMHRDIGMEKYVPPKIKDLFSRKSLIKTQKIGDGMQGMIKDLYNVLPLDKIDALFEQKMKTSKVFVDFITKITSKEMIKILSDLGAHKTYKEFITKTKEKGLDLKGTINLSIRMIGLKSKY